MKDQCIYQNVQNVKKKIRFVKKHAEAIELLTKPEINTPLSNVPTIRDVFFQRYKNE